MRLFGRQDVFLLGGLAAALLIIFSTPISHLLDYIRDIERQSGLTLMPALVLLSAIFIFHQLRRWNQVAAQAAAAEAATKEAELRAEEMERLVAFGQALGRALEF